MFLAISGLKKAFSLDIYSVWEPEVGEVESLTLGDFIADFFVFIGDVDILYFKSPGYLAL